MKRLVSLLAATGVLAVASGAMATAIPFQLNDRPAPITVTAAPTQPTLQQEMDAILGAGTMNAATDQSRVGAWTMAEGNVDAYRVALLSPNGTGKLGIFSLATGVEQELLTMNDGVGGWQVDFSIQQNAETGQYDLFVGNTLKKTGFGQGFGLYWDDTNSSGRRQVSYTLDTQNAGGAPMALSYLVKNGTSVNIPHNHYNFKTTAQGDNDWIIGFENGFDTRINNTTYRDSTSDFNDAIVYIEDMNPVPEPGTMMLLGAGFLGLAIYGKRRKNA